MFRLEDDDDEEEQDQEKDKDKAADGGMIQKLLKTRTIVLSGEINKKLAEKITIQLLVLDGENHDPIKIFIDSPGGDADAGYAIFDFIRFVSSPVFTIANGLTASAGVIIALAAKKENRFSLPNARWLIHQPSSGMMGSAADIKIHAEEIVKLKERINVLISDETGRSVEDVKKDTDRDRWLSPEEALEYGLISKIVTHATELD
jgi:ATP-dependent Clp protease protease subunit